jgi:hypothetical protein
MGFHDSQGHYHAFRSVLDLSLNSFRLATTGDVGDTTANGGLLSSNTAPTISGASTGYTQRITWIADGVVQILTQCALPADFDGKEDVLIELDVSSGGTTNLASFSVLSSWDGGATVTDTATDPAASTTVHTISARIAASDIPDAPARLSFALVPAAHSTDTMLLDAVRVSYVAKNL